MIVAAPWALNHLVSPGQSNDPQRDFTPVSLLANTTIVMLTGPSIAVGDIRTFLASAKKAPGRHTFGGADTSSMLYGEFLKIATGATLTNIPYKGGAAVLSDLLSGIIDTGFVSLATSNQYIKSGKVRALAVAAPVRDPVIPDTPTFAELGIKMPNFGWLGMFGPAGLKPDALRDIHSDVASALADAEVASDMSKLGMRPAALPPAEFKTFFVRSLTENAALLKRARIDGN